jgi:LacI family transcriptional regulator
MSTQETPDGPLGETQNRPGSFGSATIYDIAELAGVNPSTVSRALNKPGRINAVTEAKIREAAKRLNYRPNPMARSLPTGRTKMLAVIVADITNPMFFDAVRGAELTASTSGYTTVIAESQESSRNEAAALERIIPAVDGVVLATTRLGEQEIESIAKSKPVVLMNRRVRGVVDVVPDVLPGIQDAIRHLKELGHTQIAFVAGPTAAWMSTHRWQLILDAALDEGLRVVEIGPNEPTFEGGKQAMKLVHASGVSAVIAYNDLIAIGLMKAAQHLGLVVPQDLSIIGFDDIFGAELTTPALTTIKSPLELAGQQAVSRLLAMLDGTELPKLGSLATQLVLRQSTSTPRKTS